MIQAHRFGCDDRLFSTSRRVLEPPRLGVDDGGVPEPVHQHLQDGGAHGSHNTDTATATDTVPPTDTDTADTVPPTDTDTDKNQDKHDSQALH